MDKIEKAIQKLSKKEHLCIRDIIGRVVLKDTVGLNIKKLKNKDNIFRVRKGDLRVIYQIDKSGEIIIIAVDRRNEDTYKF